MQDDELPREARKGLIFHPDYAYSRFNANIRELDALLAMVFPIAGDNERSERYLTARRLKIEAEFSGPWTIDVRNAMLSWQVAMRVSSVEVYLQRALTFLGVYDAEFMRSRSSKQEWDYDAIRSSSDDDETLWTFCYRWAQNFVASGGPQRWSDALRRSGLGKYTDADVAELEAMWGYRHMRVHHAGVFTREFVVRHGPLAERLTEAGLQETDLQRWSVAAMSFVDAAERGISGRLKARLGDDLILTRQEAEGERQQKVLRARYERIMQMPDDERQAQVDAGVAESKRRSDLIDELFRRDE